MAKIITNLKYALKIEMILGALFSLYAAYFIAALSALGRDSMPPSGILLALATFIGFAILMLLIPYLAMNELSHYPAKRKKLFNNINAVILLLIGNFFLLIPSLLALWKFYMLHKLGKCALAKQP